MLSKFQAAVFVAIFAFSSFANAQDRRVPEAANEVRVEQVQEVELAERVATPAQCEATCAGADARATQTADGECTCAVDGAEVVQARQNGCTQAGCRAACGDNMCVGWRPNGSNGCNYSCLRSTLFLTDDERSRMVD